MKNTFALIILDGYGIRDEVTGNAIKKADTPTIDRLEAECPYALLKASGEDVGLPAGQMGNSEVGHANIGAGHIVYQDLTRITRSVRDGSFFENPALLEAIENTRNNNSALHIFGLLSDGGVHSHFDHLFAVLDLCRSRGLQKVYIHAFLDGRDTDPKSGIGYMKSLMDKISITGTGTVATVSGRYYSMDRDKRWERLKLAYNAIAEGYGPFDSDPLHAIQASYDNGITDEFIIPTVCDKEGQVNSGDSVIFCNFRPDRAREMTRAFCDQDFDGFERSKGRMPLCYVCFTQYDADIQNVLLAFPPESPKNTLGEYLSSLGKSQLRIAETEKYAHVTFFFNGGTEEPFPGEDRVLIPSPKVATYDLKPEMSAYEVTDEVISRIKSGIYDFIVLNFANCDMVGHTGIFDAAVSAVETVDTCLGRVLSALDEINGSALVTADHGNADVMLSDKGDPFTAHSLSPVPLFAVNTSAMKLKDGGRLCDLAPTILDLMGLQKPSEMDGLSLAIY